MKPAHELDVRGRQGCGPWHGLKALLPTLQAFLALPDCVLPTRPMPCPSTNALRRAMTWA